MIRPVVLLILDGWGLAPAGVGNAISLAKLTHLPNLWNLFPHSTLAASGEAVGLPKGEDGNTETGHLNIGAGKIVYQDLPRINMAIADGSFFQNSSFIYAIEHAKKHNSNVHLMGLIGSGGVHSNMEHLFALLWLCKNQNFDRVFIHIFTDGRDSPPKSALTYISNVQDEMSRVGIGTIASISGRYFAMDRDHRWERTKKVYEALTQGKGQTAVSPQEAIDVAYEKNNTDEFIEPTLIVRDGQPIALIKKNDSVIFFNYRIDRPRQLTKAFVLSDFTQLAKKTGFDPYMVKYYKKHETIPSTHTPFDREIYLENLFFVTMTEYEKNLPVTISFPPQQVAVPLGKVISDSGLLQLRIAETEKERFVTYYLNGQREEAFVGEDRMIVPSPKVPTYDLKPEMSILSLTEQVLSALASKKYAFILVNIANADMVAHTGVISAAISACEIVDTCVGKIADKTLAVGGACFVTADHGNVEEMIDPVTGGIDTEHSTYPVPFMCISKTFENQPVDLPSGMLADIAPTVLSLMGVPVPSTMNGRNLLASILK